MCPLEPIAESVHRQKDTRPWAAAGVGARTQALHGRAAAAARSNRPLLAFGLGGASLWTATALRWSCHDTYLRLQTVQVRRTKGHVREGTPGVCGPSGALRGRILQRNGTALPGTGTVPYP